MQLKSSLKQYKIDCHVLNCQEKSINRKPQSKMGNFHYRSAKGDSAEILFDWDLEKFQSNGAQVYVWRDSNKTWIVAKFFNVRSGIFKERQTLLSPNESNSLREKPDWLIVELSDQTESSARFRLSVGSAIQPLRRIFEIKIHILFYIELTVLNIFGIK